MGLTVSHHQSRPNMKYLGVLPVFISPAFSGTLDMQVLYSNAIANTSSQNPPGMPGGFRSMNSIGNTFPIADPMIDALTDYGCWCYFDQDVGKGQGACRGGPRSTRAGRPVSPVRGPLHRSPSQPRRAADPTSI